MDHPSAFEPQFSEQDQPRLQVVVHAGPLAGKGFPIIGDALLIGRDPDNDITLDDAEKVGITGVAKTISNGYYAPSTLLPYCSREFKELFDKADIIISKGQGNLEGLIKNREKNIFFLLMIKCNVMAEMTGAKKNNSVVYYNKKMPSL